MTPLEQWQQQNNVYLSTALTWLRLWLGFQIAQHQTANGRQASLPDALTKIDTASIEQAAHRMSQAASINPPPALVLLSQRLGLSSFEQTSLLLCSAMELELSTPNLCASLPPEQPYPTFALALSLFDNPDWEAFTPDSPLRYWQLIEIHQPPAQSLLTSPLQIDERIVSYLKGVNTLDDRLSALLIPLELESVAMDLPPSQQVIADSIYRRLTQVNEGQTLPVVQLLGSDTLSQQQIALQVTNQLGYSPHRLSVALLPTQVNELENLARLWQRESLLLPLALYLDGQGADLSELNDNQLQALRRFLTRCGGLVFLAAWDKLPHIGRPEITVDVRKPTAAEQQVTWENALEVIAPESAVLLANQFNLNCVEIQQVVTTAHIEADSSSNSLHNQLWRGCLAISRPQLARLAQPIDVRATWNDIVLPAAELDLLRQLTAQVRQRQQVYDQWGFRRRMNRGLGINALFAGDSGTGKTMAAEVIANDLKLHLYRIDLSAVVSKYIGETEKNLRRLFDAAEDGGAVLFFDEADALFGKRSEVKDSHDRYANIEINYLLQRIEAYRGLAILATNLKSSLDTAFLRRLRFVINFSYPGLSERTAIWQQAFPEEAPTERLDYDLLARFNLTGGNIHNVVLNAAFQAAQQQTIVTMPLVLSAIRTELKKSDRPISELDFYDLSQTDMLTPDAVSPLS